MTTHATEDELATTGGAPHTPIERLEIYWRLDEHIERLRIDQRPRRPPHLSVVDARAFALAALFRAACAGATDVRPVFQSALATRLARLLEGSCGATSWHRLMSNLRCQSARWMRAAIIRPVQIVVRLPRDGMARRQMDRS